MQFPLERPKSTQIQSLTPTTTCALVGETIPAPNDGQHACPGFRQTAARPACNYFFIYLFFRYREGSWKLEQHTISFLWVQSLDGPSNLHTLPPMMFFRAVVVPILGKSASAIPGSCSSALKEITDCPYQFLYKCSKSGCESFGLQKSSKWSLATDLESVPVRSFHQKFGHFVHAPAVWVQTMR